ncbi:MAG: ACT domain-containing protein [Defluviitaleaceae bacterium]|nr:ACT domain-containing protein [Defluviitaleaceae bacterium]MCL2262114.1 ACT domain-containing protein [Defluviitaleaceae bacterium]
MKIKTLDEKFSVCKIADMKTVDFSRPFVFFSKTDEELSLVCETGHVPQNATHTEHNWRAFRIDQELDFSLIGIISKISATLAAAQISVFVISTYNTDYVLIKENDFDRAIELIS